MNKYSKMIKMSNLVEGITFTAISISWCLLFTLVWASWIYILFPVAATVIGLPIYIQQYRIQKWAKAKLGIFH